MRADGGPFLQARSCSAPDAGRTVLDREGDVPLPDREHHGVAGEPHQERPEPAAGRGDHVEDALAAADVAGLRSDRSTSAAAGCRRARTSGGVLSGTATGHAPILARRRGDPYDVAHGTRPRARDTVRARHCSSRSASRRGSCWPRWSARSSPGPLALLVDAGHMVVDTGGLGIGPRRHPARSAQPDGAAHVGLPACRGPRGHGAGGDPPRRRRLRDHPRSSGCSYRPRSTPVAARLRDHRPRRQPGGVRGAAARPPARASPRGRPGSRSSTTRSGRSR